MKDNLAPIVLFVYNRPWHTKQTIEALKKNELASESELFIYSDGQKNKEAEEKVKEVREYIKNIDGFKKVTIIERKKNWGLANNIIDGVTTIINEYEKIIVLEDDLITSPYFLKFMNEALKFYKNKKNIWNITGFSYHLKIPNEYKFSTYLYKRTSSKSWATFKDRWMQVEFNEKKLLEKYNLKMLEKSLKPYGKDLYRMFKNQLNKKIDSWAIRYAVNQIMNNSYTVYPVCSYVKDIGNDYGTHTKDSLVHPIKMCDDFNKNFTEIIDRKIQFQYGFYLKKYFFKSRIRSGVKKIKRFVLEK